ncbi:MAG: PTS sugar transporter subunit IIB, partial [Mucispirillum sp.]|nr:PTS sugar transporter subunit IIB [Mucispirillum sp.]
MNRIIYRVDDRFIHGQILEGWVNYLNIPNIMIVNDVLSGDKIRTNIYKSVLPESSKLSVYSIDDFCKKQPVSKIKKNYVMIIVDSVHDLLSLKKAFNDDIYINIGCVISK